MNDASTERGIRLALKEARKSTSHRFKVGAALLDKKTVLGRGFNSRKTSPCSTARFNGTHAEYHCVRRFRGFRDKACNLTGATMFVVRLTRSGKLGMAKPCGHCQKFLRELGIRRVFFTEHAGTVGLLTF